MTRKMHKRILTKIIEVVCHNNVHSGKLCVWFASTRPAFKSMHVNRNDSNDFISYAKHKTMNNYITKICNETTNIIEKAREKKN